ncbi:MAG TPA: enoyl-CoA hydratase-related protein [Dehalococcoidales bacterium]|nr:enoyl-CoA hydratase-related protein [Dehalococcoidales bacterium]
MTVNDCEFSQVGQVGYITLVQTERSNFYQELPEICTRINGEEGIWLVVVRIADGLTFGPAHYLRSSASDLPVLSPAAAIGEINRPTIAVLMGDTIGPALEVALACDMRIGVETASFGLPQITNGNIPVDGGTQRLARLVGKSKALELILTGELIGAAEALETGLINRMVKSENLQAEVESLAATLTAKAPLAMRYCKEAVNKGLDLTLEQALRLEADLYFLLHTTSDRTEGVQSFLQKRKPHYQGK